MAHGLPYFDNIAKNPAKVVRFANAMKALSSNLDQNPRSVFDWDNLPSDGVVVDVGCGIGQVSLILAKALPSTVKVVLQDRAEVIDGESRAAGFLTCERPEEIESGRLILQPHDLPQTFIWCNQ